MVYELYLNKPVKGERKRETGREEGGGEPLDSLGSRKTIMQLQTMMQKASRGSAATRD